MLCFILFLLFIGAPVYPERPNLPLWLKIFPLAWWRNSQRFVEQCKKKNKYTDICLCETFKHYVGKNSIYKIWKD